MGQSTFNKLPAGTYYVGDLCYLIPDSDWADLLEATSYLESEDGFFNVNGVKFFSSSTAWGDGRYLDQSGREYPVDAGLIGCYPYSGPPIRGGHILTFEEDFSCTNCVRSGSYIDDTEGEIRIGNVSILTSPNCEDEEYYSYEDDLEDDCPEYW